MTPLSKFCIKVALMALATVLAACAPVARLPGPVAAVAGPAPAQLLQQVSPQSLAATEWVAMVLDGIGTTNAPRPSLRFVGAAQVIGSGGCNSFTGVVAFGDAERLEVSSLAPVGPVCIGTPGGQEDMFFKALERARQARLVGRELLLLDASGKTLVQLSKAD